MPKKNKRFIQTIVIGKTITSMSDIKHPKEIDKLYYNEEISISEALRLWDIWENSTEEEKKENAIYIKIFRNLIV